MIAESFPFRAQITIADNGSTDATWVIADRLARELPEVRAVRMELPGRHEELEGVLLRLVRPVQLHHRGQDAGSLWVMEPL